MAETYTTNTDKSQKTLRNKLQHLTPTGQSCRGKQGVLAFGAHGSLTTPSTEGEIAGWTWMLERPG